MLVDQRPCPRCKRIAERNAIEIFPDGGILFMVIHDDGEICRWTEYPNIESMMHKPRKKNPVAVVCPRCNKEGRVGWWYPTSKLGKQRMRVDYYVHHKDQKPPRHQNFTQEERDNLLQQLGRYISTPKLIQRKKTESGQTLLDAFNTIQRIKSKQRVVISKHKANCPRCHKRGRLDRVSRSSETPDLKRFYIDHEKVNGKIDRCFMRQGEEEELAKRIWSR
jgi:endogenous inhibitor of DNA gyrase (YacG/DUF329 family)